MLGPLGLIAHGLCGFVTLRRALAAIARTRDPFAGWVAALTLAVYGMALVGPQLYNPHSIPLLMLIATGSSLSKAPRPDTRVGPPPYAELIVRGQ